MISAFPSFETLFSDLGWIPVIPEFSQTLSETEICKILPSCDGWIIGDDPVTKKVLESGINGKFKAAIKWGIGTDNIDFCACEDLGVPIENTPGVFSIGTPKSLSLIHISEPTRPY